MKTFKAPLGATVFFTDPAGTGRNGRLLKGRIVGQRLERWIPEVMNFAVKQNVIRTEEWPGLLFFVDDADIEPAEAEREKNARP